MSGGCPPGPPGVAVCVVLAESEDPPQAATSNPPAVAAARITTATAMAASGLRISHLFFVFDLTKRSVTGRSGPPLGDR
jgi:hypothetical protein